MIFELLGRTVLPKSIEPIVFVIILYQLPLERTARRKLFFLLHFLLIRIKNEVFILMVFLLVLYVYEFGIDFEGLLFFLQTQSEVMAKI
jgi:hypothetical protein